MSPILCGLSLLLTQVAELTKHSEDLTQEMDRVMTKMENTIKTNKQVQTLKVQVGLHILVDSCVHICVFDLFC